VDAGQGYPHVAELWYRLESVPTRSFSNPQPVERYTDAFYVCLEDGIAKVWMKEHHATVESARQRVEEYLYLWEVSAALQYGGSPDVHFVFIRAVGQPQEEARGVGEDRRQAQGVTGGGGRAKAMAGGAMAVSIQAEYPDPPDEFLMTIDVEVLWTLYNLYRTNRYPLLPMVYAFVSYLQAIAGGRRRAEQRFCVSSNVLGKLRTLSTNLGVGAEARKSHSGSERRPPTNQEVQ